MFNTGNSVSENEKEPGKCSHERKTEHGLYAQFQQEVFLPQEHILTKDRHERERERLILYFTRIKI